MAEKGETKILVIITIIIILFSILFSGCVGDGKDENNNNKDANEENIYSISNLNLTLEINNNSTENRLNFTIKLTNIRDYPVKVERQFVLNDNYLNLIITNPLNKTIHFPSYHGDYAYRYITLNPNETLIHNTSINLIEFLPFLNQDNELISGKYIFQAEYWNRLRSNIIIYEIE